MTPQDITSALSRLVQKADRAPGQVGRPKGAEAPRTPNERQQKRRGAKREQRLDNIAVLDFETDPFDKENPDARVEPFLACLYRDGADPIVIWDDDPSIFAQRVVDAISSLPDAYTIYAHNGGKFDFLFLIHLLRGPVSFKGRGIMIAKIGSHELRDSFHIIPTKLAAMEKQSFDYTMLKRNTREQHRQAIIDYCISDCVNLLKFVKAFCRDFGFRLSIGQAAMSRLKQSYTVAPLTSSQDEELRKYFFGGRVECLAGRGRFTGPYKLYDVNSMYPAAMATCEHPIGFHYDKRHGQPTDDTVFIDLYCDNNNALVQRTANNETSANATDGRFFTTIHEYKTALRLGLISNVRINFCIDCSERTNFADFVNPLYENRLLTKRKLKTLDPNTQEYFDTHKDDLFYKLLLNNAYGKFAQNPRRFVESYLTDPEERPPAIDDETLMAELQGEWPEELWGTHPKYECDRYWIWQRPSPSKRFNNVGTAASITGAARAILMEAIHNARGAIYCDTDSLICLELPNTRLHPEELGAWDLEAEFRECIVNGKKMYACLPTDPADDKKKTKIRSKGASGLTYSDMVKLYEGAVIENVNPGPTLTKAGGQHYMRRNIRATAQIRKDNHDAPISKSVASVSR